jgi:multidrug resistance efflux pump
MAMGEARPAAPQQGSSGASNPLFRKQALDRHRMSKREGALAQLSPTWVARTYWVVMSAVAGGLIFTIAAHINQYSTGPAVIKMEGNAVTARDGGSVKHVEVSPGQRVAAGDLLVQLHGDAERIALEETELEYQQQLGTFLIEPSDASVRASLASVVARRQKAAMALETRAIRAPSAGIVSDVRVYPGSHLQPGGNILTIIPEEGMPVVVALLPGGDRPRLKEGMMLQLELPGYEKVREQAEILTIGEEVIGPTEAARYLGEKIADALPVKGSVVLVRARLNGRTFMARDKEYRYHDGMTARAEVIIRKRSALVALIPGLEKIL